MSDKYLTLDDLFHELNKDPEFRKEHRKQAPIFAIVRQVFELRKELGLTQAELAERAGTYQSNISKIEAGELDMRLSTLIAIAEALETKLEVHFAKYVDTDEAPLNVIEEAGRIVEKHFKSSANISQKSPEYTKSTKSRYTKMSTKFVTA